VKYVLALDQGTTSSRAILFNAEGASVAVAQREFGQHYPQPGWVEHDPKEIFLTQREVAREALRRSGIALGDLMGVGITNQRETTIVWDRQSGEPIYNAIVWQDRRTAPLCEELKQVGAESLVRERTGLLIDPYFSGTKIAWLLDNIPHARQRAERGELAFGTVDTWLTWHLTGNRTHVTDVSNASRTLLFNIHMGDWDDELLRLLRVPRALLPDVHPSTHAFGMLPAGVLGEPMVIGGIAGDQQAATFGQGCFRPGMAKNTYGTGCFMLLHTGNRVVSSTSGLLSTCCAQTRDPEYALEGSVFIGGAVVQWLRDGLHAIQHSGEVQSLAQSVPDSGGVMFVPAFTGLGAPYWKADARGAIVGLTRGSTVAHIARAALESIAFQSAALLQAMSRDAVAAGGAPVAELRVDGGACVNDLLMQFQADLLGIPVVRPQVIETTALGAAYLAGLSCGVYKNLDELSAQWAVERTFHPTMSRERAGELMHGWEHAVAQATL
jgi:glycerol kinase